MIPSAIPRPARRIGKMPTASRSTRHLAARQRCRHFLFDQGQIEHRLLSQKHGEGAHGPAKISRLRSHVPKLGQLVLHERVR